MIPVRTHALLVAAALLAVPLLVPPAEAASPVTWNVQGTVTSLGKTWTTIENGRPVLHTRALAVDASVSGLFVGHATLRVSSDLDRWTGAGRHWGDLTIDVGWGTLSGSLRGTTSDFADFRGSWTISSATGEFRGMRLRAVYSGDIGATVSLAFVGSFS